MVTSDRLILVVKLTGVKTEEVEYHIPALMVFFWDIERKIQITPLKTNMTSENPHVQYEIHLQMVDVLLSC